MIVYYVEPDSTVQKRTWHRTRAEAHAAAKKIPALDPVIVQVELKTDQASIVRVLNQLFWYTNKAAWTLSPRGGLRPLPLSEL